MLRRDVALGDAGDNGFCNVLVQFPAAEIVEEKERLRALHDKVVGAHRDEVDADAGVPPRVDRQLELGADAVIGGDEQRIFVPGRLEVEKPAEPAEFRASARPGRGASEGGDPLHQRVARGDRHAGVGVGVGGVGHGPGA